MWKIQNRWYVANFAYRNLVKHFDFMNKCSMNWCDSFKTVFVSINKKRTKMSNSKIIHRIKNFTSYFHRNTTFVPKCSIFKGSNMIVCVLLVSNSRGCCLATPGDHEGACYQPCRENGSWYIMSDYLVQQIFNQSPPASYFQQFSGFCYSLWITIEISLDMLWIGVNCIFKENIFFYVLINIFIKLKNILQFL